MRVLRSHRRRDDGIASVYVAVSLFMIFGAGAIAVDSGMMWAERRDMTADVDAATLAAVDTQIKAAVACTESGWTAIPTTDPAHESAVALLEDNRGEPISAGDVLVERTCVGSDGAGKIRVTHLGHVAPLFSALYGFRDLEVANSTVAQFSLEGGGLRPVALCADDGDPGVTEFEAWLAGNGPVAAEPTYLTLSWGKSWKESGAAGGCGAGGSGNWGTVCFDKGEPGVSCNANDTQEFLLNGWPYDVDLGAAPPATAPPVGVSPAPSNGWTDYDCKIGSGGDLTNNDTCDVNTGSTGSSGTMAAIKTLNCDWDETVADALNPIPVSSRMPADQCENFPILGIWELSGSGANAEIKPHMFIEVVLRHPSFLGTGNNKDVCRDEGYYSGGWDGGKHCLTFELIATYNSGTLADNDLREWKSRLCGVVDDPAGDRCSF